MYQGAVVVGARDGSTSVVPVTAAVAPTMQQDCTGQADGVADVRRQRRRRGAVEPHLQQRLGVRRVRLDVAGRSPATGDSSSSTSQNRPLPARSFSPRRRGTILAPPPTSTPWSWAHRSTTTRTERWISSSDREPGTSTREPWLRTSSERRARAQTRTSAPESGASTRRPASNSDVVASPVSPDGGLHSIVWHQVGWDGGKFDVPVTTTLSSASVDPSSIVKTVTANAGQFAVSFSSGADPGTVSAQAFGLGDLTTTTESLKPGQPGRHRHLVREEDDHRHATRHASRSPSMQRTRTTPTSTSCTTVRSSRRRRRARRTSR